MADIKISELPNATSLTDNDMLPGVNSSNTRKFTLARIRDFFKTTYDAVYAAISHDHNRVSNGTYQINMPTGMQRNSSFATTDDLTGTKIAYDHTSSGLQAENVQDAVDELNTAKLSSTDKGAANGVAGLDSGSHVPIAQLPTFIEDVSLTTKHLTTLVISATSSR